MRNVVYEGKNISLLKVHQNKEWNYCGFKGAWLCVKFGRNCGDKSTRKLPKNDVKNAEITAIMDVFQDDDMFGCYFHFKEFLWQKVNM